MLVNEKQELYDVSKASGTLYIATRFFVNRVIKTSWLSKALRVNKIFVFIFANFLVGIYEFQVHRIKKNNI